MVSQQYTTGHMNAKVETNQSALDVLKRRLEFDTAGRIRNQYTPPVPIEFGTVFGYDGLNRLVRDTMGVIETDECSWDSNNGWECPAPTTDSVRSFVYDALGNVKRDSLYRVGAGNSVATGTYNSTTGRVTNFGSCTYTTDDDGNIIKRNCPGTSSDIDSLYWSSENRLDSLRIGGQKIRNYYDAAGRLVKRDVYGTVTYFLWNGANLFAEMNSTGGKVAEYSYWPGRLDHQHALIIGSTVYFSHRDGFGNVVGLVNESKLLRRSYEYDAWGKLVGGSDIGSFNDADRARFKGALWMGEEGPELYYMRNRWYEPKTGRFLSEDPIGLAGGINLYAFAGNNPISGRDPTGLYPGGEPDQVESSQNSRDIVDAWGGGAALGLMGNGRVLSGWNPGWGNVRYAEGARPVNRLLEYVLHLIGDHLDQWIRIHVGIRYPGECTGPRCNPNSLHHVGWAADFVNGPDQTRNMRTLAHQIDAFLQTGPMQKFGYFELGWYTGELRGHVHLGIGRDSRFGYIGNDQVGFNTPWP